jgi:hypothetical protein
MQSAQKSHYCAPDGSEHEHRCGGG